MIQITFATFVNLKIGFIPLCRCCLQFFYFQFNFAICALHLIRRKAEDFDLTRHQLHKFTTRVRCLAYLMITLISSLVHVRVVKKKQKLSKISLFFIFIFMLGVCDFLLYLRQIYVVPDDVIYETHSQNLLSNRT